MRALVDLKKRIEYQTARAGSGTTATAIPNLRVIRHHLPSEPIAHTIEPSLAVVAQGTKQVALAGRNFVYGAGQYLVVSVDLQIRSHIVEASASRPFLAATLALSPNAIASLLLEAAADNRSSAPLSGLAVNNATTELVEPIVRLFRLLERSDDIPVLLPGIEREILWRLLGGDQGALVRQIGRADSRLSQISRAIRTIRDHYDRRLRVADLAARANMSPSTFHRHFRVVTALTPIQYQKQIRLQEARARLVATSDDVASIAFAIGYDSPSQFSREYSRFFGAPPGRDAGRLRARSVGA